VTSSRGRDPASNEQRGPDHRLSASRVFAGRCSRSGDVSALPSQVEARLVERDCGFLDPRKRGFCPTEAMFQHMAWVGAVEQARSTAEGPVALEAMRQVRAVRGKLGLSGAWRGKFAEEELEREDDPGRRLARPRPGRASDGERLVREG
jgi:hypothetical protein